MIEISHPRNSSSKLSLWLWRLCCVNYSAPDREAGYCDERLCVCARARVCVSVCVCLSAIISSELHVRSSAIFVRVIYSLNWLGPPLAA